MAIKLGILDQSIAYAGQTTAEALANTVKLAQLAEALGYERFWVSEHHDSAQFAGSSPEVLIGYLLASTERIRIGSGGVMLQHYSPYKVAENFNVLASLAPGRVELGIGRAPGGLPRSTKALQWTDDSRTLSDKLAEVQAYISGPASEGHPLEGLKASPIPEQPADLYILGTSVSSAELAAERGLPYVFALFINNDPVAAKQAFETYRSRFASTGGSTPRSILALSVIAADSDEEAAELAGELKSVRVTLSSGKTVNVSTEEQAQEFARQAGESYTTEVRAADMTKGAKETVRSRIVELGRLYEVEEFIITTAVGEFEQRVRSFTLLKEALAEQVV
ncbi:LLM class flavin-dependent oxidoreductase [Paenibacillus sp. 1011MAR3C5]|uniref:LLM class flavin-dependent oxidoreductase n=1 Tax=Paenibacillus sp. 1011MAR3C5 TaxID=1675787 RepID=UPI000E6CC885|nr:LLM class flavin-dependent oxidoreductase [Paenibacillus sp. 1011MAR3C5]RJE90356.1 LLM class flavin-dependent oxidoreductase [Paenibacillus sp. 1011MAR3C5]